MTFEEFQATRFATLDIGAALAIDLGILEPVAGNIYCGELYIEEVRPRTTNGYDNAERQKGKWHLSIENYTDISDDLEAFERKLYDWAVHSGYVIAPVEKRIDRELEMLTREYNAWNERSSLNLGSADEHLFDETLTQEQRDWLADFCKRWDASAPVHVGGMTMPGRMA